MPTKKTKKSTKATKTTNAGVSAFLDMTKKVGFSAIGSTETSNINDFLPTFIPSLDLITGGGIPFRRLTEVYGAPQAGKSTFMIYLTKVAASLGVPVIWIDTEGTTGDDRMYEFDIDMNYVSIFSPKDSLDKKKEILSVEKVDSIIETVIDRYIENDDMEDLPAIVIWDGIGATVAEEEATTDIDKEMRIGRQAQAITRLVKRVSPKLVNCNMALLVTNQVRANVGGMAFAPKTTRASGAKALDHAESLRLSLAKAGKLSGMTAISRGVVDNNGSNETGNKVKFKADKSKDGVSGQSTTLEVYTSSVISEDPYINLDGLDYANCLFTDALGTKQIINQSGAYYSFITKNGEEYRERGKDKLLILFEQNDELLQDLFEQTLMFYFPHRYPAMNNKNIDITKFKYWSDTLTDKYAGVTRGRL